MESKLVLGNAAFSPLVSDELLEPEIPGYNPLAKPQVVPLGPSRQ